MNYISKQEASLNQTITIEEWCILIVFYGLSTILRLFKAETYFWIVRIFGDNDFLKQVLVFNP